MVIVIGIPINPIDHNIQPWGERLDETVLLGEMVFFVSAFPTLKLVVRNLLKVLMPALDFVFLGSRYPLAIVVLLVISGYWLTMNQKYMLVKTFFYGKP